MYDLIIRNGRIVSGNGNPWFRGDIGIVGGKIALVGNLDQAGAERVIDADFRVVCPGFIDAHTHSDLSILADPGAKAKIAQGVTTEIVGLDGFSLAPISAEYRDEWRKLLAGVNGNPDLEWTWGGFGAYLDTVAAARPSVNIAGYAGLGAIRLNIMGMTDRPATDTEIARMCSLAEQSMEEGAIGVSSGLIYPPNQYQTIDEISRVARAVRRYDGVYNVHLRSEGDRVSEAIDEAVEIGRRSGIPVIITHFKVMGRRNWGSAERMLEKIDRARAEGVEVSLEQYPYTAASTVLHALVPPWYHAGGVDHLIHVISEDRESIKRDIRERMDWENWSEACGWENLMLSSVSGERNRCFEGKRLTEIASLRGIADPADAALDILVEEHGAATMIMFCMDERDVTAIMRHPSVNIITDGIMGGAKPHPRLSGSFPRVLGRNVREQGVLTLEEAVRRMTALPAEKLRLKRKGLIAEGYDADLVIFDPDTVLDTATYDEPLRTPVGINRVLVKGTVVWDGVNHTGAAGGTAIRNRAGAGE